MARSRNAASRSGRSGSACRRHDIAAQDSNGWLWQKFVWREGGHDIYAQLMGTWLAPPLWDVRYARFDVGDVADRAEEWRVTVDGAGKVRQVRHSLPEGRPGAKLSQEDARKLAQQEIRRAVRPRSRGAARSIRRAAGATGAGRLAVHVHRSARRRRQGRRGARDRRYCRRRGFQRRSIRLRAGGLATRRARAREGGCASRRWASVSCVVVIAVAALIAAIVAWSRGTFRSPRVLADAALCRRRAGHRRAQSMARGGDVPVDGGAVSLGRCCCGRAGRRCRC